MDQQQETVTEQPTAFSVVQIRRGLKNAAQDGMQSAGGHRYAAFEAPA
jgi:hypothetical protein